MRLALRRRRSISQSRFISCESPCGPSALSALTLYLVLGSQLPRYLADAVGECSRRNRSEARPPLCSLRSLNSLADLFLSSPQTGLHLDVVRLRRFLHCARARPHLVLRRYARPEVHPGVWRRVSYCARCVSCTLAVFLSGTDDGRVTLISPSGAGVIADISEPHERGMLFAYFNLGALLGPTVGPVIGGALAQGLGWRAIFWFLVIIACICLVPLIL